MVTDELTIYGEKLSVNLRIGSYDVVPGACWICFKRDVHQRQKYKVVKVVWHSQESLLSGQLISIPLVQKLCGKFVFPPLFQRKPGHYSEVYRLPDKEGLR